MVIEAKSNVKRGSRVIFVDIIRGVAVLSVLLGHISTTITRFIYSWHLPLFFFVSGFFFKSTRRFLSIFKKEFFKNNGSILYIWSDWNSGRQY